MKVKGIFEIKISQIEVIQGLLPRLHTHTIEEKVEEYKEAMSEGEQFPPIVVWDKGNGIYWLIDGMHRLLALKRLGKDTIKAEVVELADELEARILAIEKNMLHGIPLSREEKKELARLLYADGVEIEKLKRLFRVSERTIYNWVEGIRRRAKDEELKRQALELRRQGLSQQEVAERLGVSQRVISNWERESLAQPAIFAGSSNENNSQLTLINPNGTPTQEGLRLLSEYIEENEEKLREKPFSDVIEEPALGEVFRFLYETVKKDLKKFVDEPYEYEKVKNLLMSIYPYRELSIRSRRIFFDKVQSLWEKLRKEREEEKKLEREVLEKAKAMLANPGYVFHTWRTVREDLARIGGMDSTFVYMNKEKIEAILRQHSDELMEIYRTFPEATPDAISEEELKEIKEKVKNTTDRWGRKTQIREEVERLLKEKKLRPVNATIEELAKRVEELIRQEEWEELEQKAKEIEETTPEEEWEALKRDKEEFEKRAQEEQKKPKTKDKQEKPLPPPGIEEWYRKELKGLLLKMGLAIGWQKTFEIAEEVLKEVKEESKNMVRGW